MAEKSEENIRFLSGMTKIVLVNVCTAIKKLPYFLLPQEKKPVWKNGG
jgi:hypothetical protein